MTPGYVALTSYSDRVSTLNDIQRILTLMRTWNNDAQSLEQTEASQGISDDEIALQVKNALRGMGPGTDLQTSNRMNTFLTTSIAGNYNTADHRYWSPLDASLPYSRGLSWLHSYPNPVRIKLRETENFFFSPGNNGKSVEFNLYRADAKPLYAATVTGQMFHRGLTGSPAAHKANTGVVADNPYLVNTDMASTWAYPSWTYDATYQTLTSTAAGTGDTITSIGAVLAANRGYDIYVKIDSITTGGLNVSVGGTLAINPITGSAYTATAAGWHWFYVTSTANNTGQVTIIPTAGTTCTVSEIKAFRRTFSGADGLGSSCIGWAEEGMLGSSHGPLDSRTTHYNCSLIAARKLVPQTVIVSGSTTQTQVAMCGYPFSDFKEDTAYNNDTPNYDGDIIQITNGPPLYTSVWAIVREVLWDPVSGRRGCAIRVQQLYDTGSVVIPKPLGYPVLVSEPTLPTATDSNYSCSGCQIYRRFTYSRA